MDRNSVLSDEALTIVTASTFLKLQWVTDQINDDHIDAEENRFEESAIYALFITNEPNQLQWVTNQINDDRNDAEENTLEESATYALFITNEPIHVQQQVKTIFHTFESNEIICHQRRHGKAHLHRYEECKMLY